MPKRKFSHFKYRITKNYPSVASVVEVTFDYKDHNITRYVVVKNTKNLDRNKVIKLARKRIRVEKRRGLKKYSENYINSNANPIEPTVDASMLPPQNNKKKILSGIAIVALSLGVIGLTTGLVLSLNNKNGGGLPKEYTVYVDANGGYFDNKIEDKTYSYTVLEGTNLFESIIEQEKNGHSFNAPEKAKDKNDYWYELYDLSSNNWKKLQDHSYTINENISLRYNYNIDSLKVEFTAENVSGTFTTTEIIENVSSGTTFGELMANPENRKKIRDLEELTKKDGFKFNKWAKKVNVGNGEFNYIPIDEDTPIGVGAGGETHFYTYDLVHINFDGGEFGNPRYADEWFPIDEKWSVELQKKYNVIIHPDVQNAKKFAGYKIGDNEVKIGDTINSPGTFIAQYNSIGNFKTDTWVDFKDTIIDFYTNKSEREKNLYYDEYISTEEGKETNSFIGLKRTVKSIGKTYTVTVIDEPNEETGQKLSEVENHGNYLAFQFDEVVKVSDSMFDDRVDPESSESTPAKYIDSNLDNFLVNDLPNFFDSEFVENVNSANNLISGQASASRRFYIPSASELGFDYASVQASEYEGKWEDEGTAFKYYKDDSSRKKQKENTSGTLVDYQYWTRSVDTASPVYCWFINTDGSLGQKDEGTYYSEIVTTKLGIAPIFEIGGNN